MSSRDFSSGQFPNSYRQPPSGPRDRSSSHWDPRKGGSSRGVSGDYDRDRDRGFYDRDRDHDHDSRERERDRRQEPRDRELTRRSSDINRPAPGPQSQSPSMPSDKVSAEVAKEIRAACDIMTQKVQLSYRKDIEIKASKKREQDYNNKHSGAKQFPAVRELYAKYNKHHKDMLEPMDKKLADLETELQNVTKNIAASLVKDLPVNEVKTRQVIEAAKAELSRETESLSSQPAQGDRLQKLEERVNSLIEKDQAKDRELANLKKLNDKLRSEEKEREQLQSANQSLKTQLDSLAERLGSVEAWKAEYPKTFDSQLAEHSKSMEQVKAECSSITTQVNSRPLQDHTTREQIGALGQKDDALSAGIAALKNQVDVHEQLLANVDIEMLDDIIAKVQDYPIYSALNTRVTSQQTDIDSLKGSLHANKQEFEQYQAQTFQRISSKIIEYCGPRFNGFEDRVKVLEAADSSADVTPNTTAYPPSSTLQGISSRLDAADSLPSTEASRIDITETGIKTLHSNFEALQSDIVAIRGQVDNRCSALEMMVESLDDQWKNLNTTQMAQYMLEHLSRLQPSQLTPELRQLHLRLADVEKVVQDEKQERQAVAKKFREAYEKADPGAKRVYAEDEAYHRQKRTRIEGSNSMNNVNGVANGHPHQ